MTEGGGEQASILAATGVLAPSPLLGWPVKYGKNHGKKRTFQAWRKAAQGVGGFMLFPVHFWASAHEGRRRGTKTVFFSCLGKRFGSVT